MEHVVYSVVIPLHNKEKYIGATLESVMAQSFKGYEIIVIDDSSTDGSLDMLAPYLDRIRLYRRSSPGPGGYAARNLGVQKAIGRYICFLDADDKWHRHHLANLHNLTRIFPAAKVLSNSWTMVSDKGSTNCHIYSTHSLTYSSYAFTALEYFKIAAKGIRPIHMSASCVSSEFAKVDEYFFPSNLGIRNGGDVYAWHLAVARAGGMVWSSYIGCEYYIGIPGQVISQINKNTSTALVDYALYEKVDILLEQKSLRKYWSRIFNKNIYTIAKRRAISGKSNMELRSRIRFRHDIIFASCLYILTVFFDLCIMTKIVKGRSQV